MTTALIIGGGMNVSPYNREDYDLLCVVNLGIQEFTHVDIWVSGLVDIEQQRALMKGREVGMLLRVHTEDLHWINKYPIELHSKVVVMDSDRYKALKNFYRPKKPTTGVAGIWYLMEKCDTVYYTGFDGYETPNRFNLIEGHTAENHNFSKDKIMLDVWSKNANLVKLT